MNVLFLTAVLILSFLYVVPAACGENYDEGTDIIIIGTVHENTKNYNSDTLLTILNRIDPDIVLVECDSSYMTRDFQLLDHVKDAFLETKALTGYMASKKLILRPYDITGRDEYLDRFDRRRNESNFFNDIDQLFMNNKLSEMATSTLTRIMNMMGTAGYMANAGAIYINGEGSRNIDSINYYSYNAMGKLIDAAPELSSYKQYWDEEYNFWVKRNNVMVENILNLKKGYPGKTIVVLCGFSHKNLLKEGLSQKLAAENITLKEYWEY